MRASLSRFVVGRAHKLPLGGGCCENEEGGGAERVGEGGSLGADGLVDLDDLVLPDMVEGKKG
jgi:hypothetical protein